MLIATLQSPRVPEGLGGDDVLSPAEEQRNTSSPFCKEALLEWCPASLVPWVVKAFTWPGGAWAGMGQAGSRRGPVGQQEDQAHPHQGWYRAKGTTFFFEELPERARGTRSNNIVGEKRHEMSHEKLPFKISFSRKIYHLLFTLLHWEIQMKSGQVAGFSLFPSNLTPVSACTGSETDGKKWGVERENCWIHVHADKITRMTLLVFRVSRIVAFILGDVRQHNFIWVAFLLQISNSTSSSCAACTKEL